MAAIPDDLTVRAAGNAAGWRARISKFVPDSQAGGRLGVGSGIVASALGGAVGGAAAALSSLGGEELPVELSHEDFYADIEVSAGLGLNGASVTLQVLGLPEKKCEQLKAIVHPKGARKEWLKLEVFMFWRSASGLPALPKKNEDAHKVATCVITEIARDVDGLQYRTTIRAHEFVLRRLSALRLSAEVRSSSLEDCVRSVLSNAGLKESEEYVVHRPKKPKTDTLSQNAFSYHKGERIVEVLTTIGGEVEQRDRRKGRGVYLFRKGVLHVGTFRPIPFDDGRARLTEASEVISVTHRGTRVADEGFSFADHPEALEAPSRAEYEITLKGAERIRVGDVLSLDFEAPGLSVPAIPGLGEIAGLATELTGAGGKGAELFVESVAHRLGKNRGFVTTVVGVVVDTHGTAEAAVHDLMRKSEQPIEGFTGPARASGATGADEFLDAVSSRVWREMTQAALPEVAEVRSFSDQASSVSVGDVTEDTPPQTECVIEGLADPNITTRGARSLDARRTAGAESYGVPYATSFAWGRYGHVLPRYPGMRVLLAYRNGRVVDPIDIGALWHTPSSQQNDGPNAAKAGDWWINLPAGIDPASLSVQDNQSVQIPASAKATNDLIDRDGNRVIEVGEFLVRVMEPAALPGPGVRPPRPAGDLQGGIVLEHKKAGSKLAIKADGTIVIEAAGDLELKAKNVNVTLGSGGKMKVT